MKKFQYKGLKVLLFIVALYCLLALFDPEKILIATTTDFKIFYSLIPIFILIIFISSLINYFVKPKHIVNHIGEDSGVKGIFYAIASGILSHGPLYMWYGILKEMRESGAKEKLLIIFLYARAVKLPLLVFMIDLFGLAFTIIMTLFTLLASVIQGHLYEFINKKTL